MTGQCNRCGVCCKTTAIIVPNDEPTREWCDARGFECNSYNDNYAVIYIPHVCPHYVGGGCDLHDSGKKPDVCKVFPGNLTDEDLEPMGLTRDDMLPDCCGYKKGGNP